MRPTPPTLGALAIQFPNCQGSKTSQGSARTISQLPFPTGHFFPPPKAANPISSAIPASNPSGSSAALASFLRYLSLYFRFPPLVLFPFLGLRPFKGCSIYSLGYV